MIVVDTNDRIIDANPAALSLFDRTRDTLLGTDADDVVAWTALCPAEPISVSEETTIGGTDVRVEISPLSDDLDRFVGYVVLVQDISELKRRERQLRRQNRQLDRFASVVSHDLRNPLNVVSGNLELAMETGNLDRLEQAEEGVERMAELIDDLLALARHGDDVSEREEISLSSLASEAWETVETGEATLVVDTSLTVEGDPFRLRQLLENLYRNSAEHGGEDVTVTVGDCWDGQEPDGFYVADDGPGIPPEHREQILEDGFSTAENGTGIGLSIVQGIAESHGWDLVVTESEDGGARFDIRGVTLVSRAEQVE